MKPKVQRISTLGILLIGTALSGLGTSAAQAPNVQGSPQVQENYSLVVRTIEVNGNQRIEDGTVRSYLPIEPGMQVGSLEIDAALKSLYATNLFEDASIIFDPRRGVLEVTVQENPIVNRVIFLGNKRTQEDKFKEEIQLEPRAVYTRAKQQADAQRIIEVYRRAGRFGATVVPKIKRLPQNRVDVIYEIDEGPKTGIKQVNFLGNEAFSDAELRGAILTAPTRWWNILESNDNYDPDRLEYDRELLRQFYSKNGYADFSVVSAVAELTPDRKNFIITFTVDEGPKYTFGNVDVNTTLSKLPGDLLRSRVPIRTGTTFNSELLEKAEEAITFSTGIAGYAFVDVNPRLDLNPETKTVDVTFDVNEGPRVYVEEININGNTQTLDRVIRREMRLVEGDAFNRVLIDRSERRVKGLGYFSEVEIVEEPGSAPDRTVLNVNVTEQPTGSFQIGGGVSSNDNFIFNIQVEQSNLLGRGQYVLLNLQASQRTNQAQLSLTERYFLGRALRASASLFYNSTDFEEAGFVSNSFGTNFSLGFPSSEFSSLLLNYGLRFDSLELSQRVGIEGLNPDGTPIFSDTNNDGNPDISLVDPSDFEIIRDPSVDGSGNPVLGIIQTDRCNITALQRDLNCERNGEFTTSQLGYTFRLDKTNDPIVPSGGFDLSLSQSFAGLGGDVNFHRSTIRAGYYHRLPARLVGSLKFNGGYIDSFNDDGVRLNDRFFLGGNRGFRGFDVAGVGPRLFNVNGQFGNRGQAIGARAYAIGTAEALLPLPLPPSYGVRASLFVDAGYVGLTNERDDELFNIDSDRRNFFGDESLPLATFDTDEAFDPDFYEQSFDDNGDPVTIGGENVFVLNSAGLAYNDLQLDDPLQDDFAPRVTAGISINWNSPFGPIQIDLSEALVVEEYDRPQSFRFSAGGRF
ncbi:outer membrane protein assembly factor BamA [Parvularcula lutaonensis]|uniref:Outer membrane protein assembly factor BamA n=1 Tax=Parvularcula lutaonensis TaxID=491923 RepID=A0ABV7MFX7_9PROT|nr:outer membrane protein assembly factor BamA [Parvularcula lutaonensis]GGY54429.1 outer membrane protein assembly factor BamA [Parvularcula lutaonensis]